MESKDKIFSDIAKNKYPVIVWNLTAGHMIKAEVVLESVVMGRKAELHFNCSDLTSQLVEQMISGSAQLNFFVAHKGVFFTSTIISFSGKKLVVEIPADTDFQDRRNKERVDAFDVTVKVQVGERSITKNGFNLSTGGIALVFMKAENIRELKRGESFPLSLRYQDDLIELKGLVVDVKKVDPYQHETLPYGGQRVAFEFVEMKNIDRVRIAGIMDALR